MARALVDESVVHQLVGTGVDPVQHIGGFAGVHRPFSVRADAHAFRLNADIDLREYLFVVDVDHRHQRVVLVGDVQPLVVRVQRELFGVSAGRQLFDDLPGRQVHDLHRVRVAGADVEQLVVARQRQSAWTLAYFKGFDRFQRIQIDHADGVVFFVRHIGGGREGGCAGASEGAGNGSSKECSGHRKILLL